MASKSYGTTWWGREWLAALTKIDNANRIPRGKTYANTGKVLDLSIDGGKVTARVKGHYASFYKIVLTVPQVSSADTAWLAITSPSARRFTVTFFGRMPS